MKEKINKFFEWYEKSPWFQFFSTFIFIPVGLLGFTKTMWFCYFFFYGLLVINVSLIQIKTRKKYDR